MMNPDAVGELERHIARWSRSQRANVTLRSYAAEIQLWKQMTGTEHVASALEVGCGSGLFLASCVAIGFARVATGIDPTVPSHGTSPEAFDLSQALVERLELPVTFQRLGLEEYFALRSGVRFDVAIFRNSLHHIYPRKPNADAEVVSRCVATLERVRSELLGQSGHIWIMESDRPGVVYQQLHNFYRRARGNGPMNWLEKRTTDEWADVLLTAGYKRIRRAALPVNRFVGTPLERLSASMLGSTFLLVADA